MEEAADSVYDGGTTARDLLESKLDIVRTYMVDNFGIDLDRLRNTVLRREQDIIDGKIDLADVSVD